MSPFFDFISIHALIKGCTVYSSLLVWFISLLCECASCSMWHVWSPALTDDFQLYFHSFSLAVHGTQLTHKQWDWFAAPCGGEVFLHAVESWGCFRLYRALLCRTTHHPFVWRHTRSTRWGWVLQSRTAFIFPPQSDRGKMLCNKRIHHFNITTFVWNFCIFVFVVFINQHL